MKVSIVSATQHDNIGTIRVLIPKIIRDKLKIKKGDRLLVSYTNNKIIYEVMQK